MRIGFDNKKYVKEQTKNILKRVEMFDSKLYLELGGKIFDDMHASRVLPGFESDAKIQVLNNLKDKLEVLICINAGDIEKNKVNSNVDLTYELDALRLIDELKELGFLVNNVVITLYKGQPSADIFRKKLERRNIKTYIHTYTKGYPTDIDTIVSDEGYGANSYVETTRPIVIVSSPGPGSGKLATSLSQLYHEYKRGRKAGYAKFETFPLWNLPLKHPINIAYEVATADLKDVNMIDNFHLEKYGVTAVNYNRDLEVFPVLKRILYKISGEDIYYSPTDMGVNMVGFAISNEDVVKKAAADEMIRRYYRSLIDYKKGLVDEEVPKRIKVLMDEANVSLETRKVVKKALEKSAKEEVPVTAIELLNGKIITGKNTKIMTSGAALIINTLKYFANIDDEIKLLSPSVLEPMLDLKRTIFKSSDYLLDVEDVLIGLSICSATNPVIETILSKLPLLKGLEAHCSFISPKSDINTFRHIGINLTMEPEYYSKSLYFS